MSIFTRLNGRIGTSYAGKRHYVPNLADEPDAIPTPTWGPTSKQSAELAEGLHTLLRHTDSKRPPSGRATDEETR